METRDLLGFKEILKYPENYVATSVVLDKTAFADVAAANDGVVPAGTFLAFDYEDLTVPATPGVGAATTGVLRHDIALNGKQADGCAAVIQGVINPSKLPVAPTDEQKAALVNITFLR